MTGYSAKEVIGKNSADPSIENTDKKEKSTIRKALEKQESIRVTPRQLHQSGQGILDRSQYSSSTGQNGKLTHFASIQRDISKQKNLERELQILCRTDP